MSLVARSIALAALLGSLGLGGWTATSVGAESQAQLADALARQRTVAEAARASADAASADANDPLAYRREVEAALAEHGLALELEPLLQRLREPNVFFHPISQSAPRRLKIGDTLREQDLELRVYVADLRVQSRGIDTTSKHTLIELHNRGTAPVAYRLLARASDGSDCRLRALTRYDAVILQPDELVQISVCSGNHGVELLDLRFIELTPLGAIWLAQLPPRALGLDDHAVRSHQTNEGVTTCTTVTVPTDELNGRLARDELAWEDVVDFYSRHDCLVHAWQPAYRRIVEPLTELPARAE